MIPSSSIPLSSSSSASSSSSSSIPVSSSSSTSSSSSFAQGSPSSSKGKKSSKFAGFRSHLFKSRKGDKPVQPLKIGDIKVSQLLTQPLEMHLPSGAEGIRLLSIQSLKKIKLNRLSSLEVRSRSFTDPVGEYEGKALYPGVVEDDFKTLQLESMHYPADPQLIGCSYVNNYPRHRKDLQLNADAFWCGTFLGLDLTLCVLADGCGPGSDPREAAQKVVSVIKGNIIEGLPHLRTLDDLAKVMISAFDRAHNKLIEKTDYSDRITTVTVSIAFTAKSKKRYLFVTSLGDCKSYLCLRQPEEKALVVDLLQYQRRTFMMSDPGGILGGVHFIWRDMKKLFILPDLRNFTMIACEVPPGDWFVCSASDGLADNLDPMALKIPPATIDPTITSEWEPLDNNVKRKLITQYSTEKLAELLGNSSSPEGDLDGISQRLTAYTSDLTREVREYLENNPKIEIREAPPYPGKMDHTSVVIFRVSQQRGIAVPSASSSSSVHPMSSSSSS